MRDSLRCDEAQVWLERARYEALGAEEVLQLEQHVAGCAACQAWRASIGQVEGALAAQPNGDYTGTLLAPHTGRWEVRVRARRGEERFLATLHAEAP